jgi:predicted ATPase/class 3 adenylate cyclase
MLSGAEISERPPVGTIAMLFTDIEGSTRLASRLGDGWAAVLAAHHELVSTAIAVEGGYVDGTEGDAFFATFADTAAAARAALTAQRAVRAHAWPQEVGELRVRMGLHAGHVERHATGYVGLEVHRAARVAAAAHGGQILLTAAARDLAGDMLPTEPLGAHRLKDFPSPESLFCAVIDGRGAAAFPPPRAYEARPTNLPAGQPALIGRDDEVSEIRRLLVLEGERLVTITGRGGAGKTSLALVVGGQLLDEHPGGVWLVRLATVAQHDQMLGAVAAAVGAEGDFGTSPLAAIAARLSHHGATLLILDNLERLVAAAPDIAALLASAPELRVLVTSQVPLHLDREYVFVVDALADDAALQLMARVARRRAVTIAADSPTREVLLHIIRLLDSLPLALELAAARLTLMSPEQLRDRLHDSLELLREDRSDRPDRQRSLVATVDWTLALLDESPRTLFARLGVFAGPVELTEIEAIAGSEGVEVLQALPSLLDVALVRRVESGDGRVRFGLPEALRQLAVRQLDGSSDGVTWRRAHAERMDEVVTAARSLSVPGDIYAAALAGDLEIAAALRWTRAVEHPLAISLAVGRTMVLAEEGRLREALEVSSFLGDVAPADPDLHAWTLACRVYPNAFLNRLAEAQDLAHRAVELAVQPLTRTVCLEACGLAYVFAGDGPTGLVYHREASAIARGLDPATLSGALILEAQAYLYSGDPDRAEATAAEFWSVGLPVDASYLWKRNTFYADLAMVRGRPEEALGHYAASLHAAQERDNQLQMMFDLLGAAVTLAALHRDADALDLMGIVRAAVAEFGGAGAQLVSHLLRDEELREAERRAGPSAVAEHEARGRAVPAAMRVARACDLARAPGVLA